MADDREAHTAALMRAAMDAAKAQLPADVGIVLLTFPFGGPPGARTNYISNCNRSDVLAALKEIVARWEGRAHDAPPGKQ